jgi:hypothetical protein
MSKLNKLINSDLLCITFDCLKVPHLPVLVRTYSPSAAYYTQ